MSEDTPYSVVFLPAAARQLAGLRRQPIYARLVAAIQGLATNPKPGAARELVGVPGWRLRVGDYRIIYEIDEGECVITVVTLGHRRDVYR